MHSALSSSLNIKAPKPTTTHLVSKFSSFYLLIYLFPLCINHLKYNPFIKPERAPPVGIVRNHHPSIPYHPIPSLPPHAREKTPNTIQIAPNPSLYVCIYSILPTIAYRINTPARKKNKPSICSVHTDLLYSILFQPVFSVLAYPSKAFMVKSTTSGTVDQGPNVSVTPQPSCIAFLL
jgi:hypothetical protein